MLGSLARWLRILGYDTAYDNRIEDREILRRCLQENRIPLTRDRLLIQQSRLPRQLLIKSEPLFEQIHEVLALVGDEPDPERLLTRCLTCKTLLAEVARAKIRTRIPPYVYQTQSRYKECPSCPAPLGHPQPNQQHSLHDPPCKKVLNPTLRIWGR